MPIPQQKKVRSFPKAFPHYRKLSFSQNEIKRTYYQKLLRELMMFQIFQCTKSEKHKSKDFQLLLLRIRSFLGETLTNCTVICGCKSPSRETGTSLSIYVTENQCELLIRDNPFPGGAKNHDIPFLLQHNPLFIIQFCQVLTLNEGCSFHLCSLSEECGSEAGEVRLLSSSIDFPFPSACVCG